MSRVFPRIRALVLIFALLGLGIPASASASDLVGQAGSAVSGAVAGLPTGAQEKAAPATIVAAAGPAVSSTLAAAVETPAPARDAGAADRAARQPARSVAGATRAPRAESPARRSAIGWGVPARRNNGSARTAAESRRDAAGATGSLTRAAREAAQRFRASADATAGPGASAVDTGAKLLGHVGGDLRALAGQAAPNPMIFKNLLQGGSFAVMALPYGRNLPTLPGSDGLLPTLPGTYLAFPPAGANGLGGGPALSDRAALVPPRGLAGLPAALRSEVLTTQSARAAGTGAADARAGSQSARPPGHPDPSETLSLGTSLGQALTLLGGLGLAVIFLMSAPQAWRRVRMPVVSLLLPPFVTPLERPG